MKSIMCRIHTILVAGLLCGLIPVFVPAQENHDPGLWERMDIETHGFADVRVGTRVKSDPNEKQTSLGETRLQLDLLRYFPAVTFEVRGDLLYDWALNDSHTDLDTGAGWFDLREANALFSPTAISDVKLGRQILTWGTGDLLFINDMFPKDWQSFFIGRDEEYLKAPSDAAFVSFFPEFANIDLVYTPRFDPDRYISGQRISYWSPARQQLVGRDDIVNANVPDDWFKDDEIAARVYRNVNGYELAAYGYWGYWKSPAGMDPATGQATFPRLNVYGGSLRGSMGKGIANLEAGYYDSRQDHAGTNPYVRNSEIRALAGYEQEVRRNLTAGIQYYIEHMMHHRYYLEGLPPGAPASDRDRHVLTLRITQLLMNQNLTLGVFGYYSPSDNDTYVRPNASYKLTDDWMLTGGANLFYGHSQHTFFGQFEKNNNLYAGVRYNF